LVASLGLYLGYKQERIKQQKMKNKETGSKEAEEQEEEQQEHMTEEKKSQIVEVVKDRSTKAE
jgi:hypothetical protein